MTKQNPPVVVRTTSNKTYVKIRDNPQGWLRVRVDGAIDATESAKVKPGEKYEFLDEKTGWFKIKYNDNKDGLVSGRVYGRMGIKRVFCKRVNGLFSISSILNKLL